MLRRVLCWGWLLLLGILSWGLPLAGRSVPSVRFVGAANSTLAKKNARLTFPPREQAERAEDGPRMVAAVLGSPHHVEFASFPGANRPGGATRGRAELVRKALATYVHHPVNARDNSPWEVMHWIIAYDVRAQIHRRGPGGELVNAVGWLCFNQSCRGQRILALSGDRVVAQYGPGLEGHAGQLMAILAQSRVKADYPIRVDDREFTVADLVESQKRSCRSNTELTFQLIGLSHYLDLDETWENEDGEAWSIPRLLKAEIESPIRGAACGGTHRLMGLSYAVKKRQQRGQLVTGEYRRAQLYVEDYIQFALRMQNSDGSFSTEWFNGRGARPDLERRLQTTGHILEWLMFACSDEQLSDPRILKAVDYLARLLVEEREQKWEIGHLGHALRALTLYDRRVLQPPPAAPPAKSAESPTITLLVPIEAQETLQ